jgi:tol-pal system protein YbgF
MKLRALWLAGCCLAVASSASAGLLSDDEARKQIQQLEARISAQASAMSDLQTQVDTLNADLRKLRGQDEELAHDLQDAEKRQKDFYIDLDTRLRRFEAVDNAAPAAQVQPASQPAAAPTAAQAAALQPAADDPAVEDRAYEAGYAFFRANSYQNAVNAFQEFLKKFPNSVFVPNVHFWMGESYFALKDYKSALTSYLQLADKYAYSPKAPDAMLSAAGCQQELKSIGGAKKTLKQLIAKYPDSEAAGKAKKLLKTLK